MLLLSTLPPLALSTYPPSPEDRRPDLDLLSASRVALYSGRAEQAYRLLLTARPEGAPGPDWLDAAARVYVGLDRPLLAAEALMELGLSDAGARERAVALLERQGPGAAHPAFQNLASQPVQTEKKVLKSWTCLLPSPDGNAYVLADTGLSKVGPSGRVEAVAPLTGGVDLCSDWKGQVVALGESQLLWGPRRINLPGGLVKPASVAVTPDGGLVLLDEKQRRLYRLDEKGNVLGSAPLTLKEPFKVRSDMAGRIFVADRASGTVSVFNEGMVPIRVLDPEARGQKVRKIEELCVDFAGDVLLLDGRSRSVFLFSAQGQFLAATGEAWRMDLAGWDGLRGLIYADFKNGVVRRLRT